MYRFDPTLLQIVLATVLALCVAFVAAWLVAAAGGPDGSAEGESGTRSREGTDELDGRQKAILWTAAGTALVFLIWWASLPGPSSGGPGF